jgi:hypothetical protein
MGISQKIRAVIKLLKEIDREYATMTRKNKCIPSTKKKGRISKRETKKSNTNSKSKSVRFKPLTEPEEPEVPEEPEEQAEPVEQVNPFEEPNEEPIEEETNPLDDGLTRPSI